MQLPHIAARLYGTPLLINRAKLDVILAVLGDRIGLSGAAMRDFPKPDAVMPSSRTGYQDNPPGIAVIPVQGTLVKRTLGLEAASGLTSYGDIAAMLDAAVRDPNVRGILLDVDSPGGETGGVFELGEAIRAASTIKPVWAVANDNTFSAAYAIACAASRVIVTRTGGVGSIGVIAMHVDQSVADAKDGFRYTAITAGKNKNDYSPHEPLSTEAQLRLQTEVNRLYDLFVAHVVTMRGLSEETVRATEAGLYFGPEGVNIGLADAVSSFEETLTEFTLFITSQGRSRSPVRAQSQVGCAIHSQQENTMQQDVQEAPLQTAPEAPKEAQQEIVPAVETIPVTEAAVRVAEARTETRREIQSIAELCLLAGMPGKTAEYIGQGKTEAEVRQLLVTMKSAQQSPEILSTIDPDKASAPLTAATNPLLSAVKQLNRKE